MTPEEKIELDAIARELFADYLLRRNESGEPEPMQRQQWAQAYLIEQLVLARMELRRLRAKATGGQR